MPQFHVDKPYGEPGVFISDERTALVCKLYPGQEHHAPLLAAAPKLYTSLKFVTEFARQMRDELAVAGPCPEDKEIEDWLVGAEKLLAEIPV